MKQEELIEARKEASRFLDSIIELEESKYFESSYMMMSGTKLSATVKRRSMDLTNALVKLRQ